LLYRPEKGFAKYKHHQAFESRILVAFSPDMYDVHMHWDRNRWIGVRSQFQILTLTLWTLDTVSKGLYRITEH
jgi:hypothetical protein